jgi:RNA-directed DNA polymerase
VIEPGKGFAPTEEGTPQGGVASPLLLCIALHGLEEAAGARYRTGTHAGELERGSPAVCVYADDLVVCCQSRQQAEQVMAQLAGWLAARGLKFSQDKTRIVHVDEGFSFLGFDLRRYRNGKLLIKPGKAAVARLRQRLKTEFRRLRGSNITAVLAAIGPKVRGWCAYYRTVVSKRVFSALDEYLWKLTWKWACWTHPNKPKHWIAGRYYGRFVQARNDRWVFGDKETGAYLPKPSWTPIRRHTLVAGGASPDDPALAGYWTERRRKVRPPLDEHHVWLLDQQHGNCPICREPLLRTTEPPQSPEGWERWFLRITRMALHRHLAVSLTYQHPDGPGRRTCLVHTTCRRVTQTRRRQPEPAVCI